ncbi:MAG TPA: bifunctional phosphopantothenoylcysteine decarboxylase/phosphopantothenate--cysteine ligase CoaBC [Methanomassiliicoccales archaeon]|jgi:phosphopantothenoylcysteine decarboxylase/phosphopantothenate--cysteine ligase
MHPSEAIRCAKSKKLFGRRIVLGITGSIAAVECLELARELIRHGAEVHAVLSSEARKIITPCSMVFATGNEAITDLDGWVQHVDLLGSAQDRVDLLLIAPCTANTISKISCGIDDTPVTTMATTALGSKTPIMIAPAMHAAMYDNPIVQTNISALKYIGLEFVGPRMEEGKAKVATNEEIVEAVLRRLGKGDYRGKKVLVIGGSSEEPIDDMRVITNRGTGETAVELAKAAHERGADVELWMGRCSVALPSYIPTRRFVTVEDLVKMVPLVAHDMVFVPAALSDFAPKRTAGKISSEPKELELSLEPVVKVLPLLRKKKVKLIGFKAESGMGETELVVKAEQRLKQHKLDAIVANDLTEVRPGLTSVLFITSKGKYVRLTGTKREVADLLLDKAA